MANLDELYSQIPTQQIANTLGVDTGEVDSAIKTLVPVLVGGLHQNAQDSENAAKIESAVTTHAASGLLDGGVNVDEVDQQQGHQEVARIFGGNDTGQVASALAGAGVGGNDLIRKVLPILAPIVMAYVGKQLLQQKSPAAAGAPQQAAGGLGGILGNILGGAAGGGGSNPLGSILSGVLGGKQGGAIGEVLGGLLSGNK
jgi:hypothetical protein